VGRRKVSISSDAKRIPGGNSGPANKASGHKLPTINISKAKLQSSADFYDEISSELGLGHTPTPWKEVSSAATPMLKGKMLCACSFTH
jgi:hypothetical protein